jgi:hypothetical protein
MTPPTPNEDYFDYITRPPTNPSFLCNLFWHKNLKRTQVDDFHAYYECERCGERQGYFTGKFVFNFEGD